MQVQRLHLSFLWLVLTISLLGQTSLDNPLSTRSGFEVMGVANVLHYAFPFIPKVRGFGGMHGSKSCIACEVPSTSGINWRGQTFVGPSPICSPPSMVTTIPDNSMYAGLLPFNVRTFRAITAYISTSPTYLRNARRIGGWLEVWECGDCQVSASRIVVISSVAGVVGVPFRTLHLGLYFRPSTVTPWSFRAQRSWEVASNCDHGEG